MSGGALMCSAGQRAPGPIAMSTCGIETRPCEPSDHQAWDAFVQDHPCGTVFHRLAWSRAVANAYGHTPAHLTAWEGGRLVGLVPLFQVESLFVGRVMISVPYATYGGILAESDQAAARLLLAAQATTRDHNAAYLELRHRDASGLDLPELGRYDTFRKDLPDRVEDVLPSFPKKARAATRQGLAVLTVETGDDLLDTVYDLYARTMRRLGSPNYRRRLFHELQQQLAPNTVCLVVRHEGVPVAGVVAFVFRDEIVPYFSGSTPRGRAHSASNVMYLKLMEYAVDRGLKSFDFNRTRRDNTGPYAFKKHLGFEPSPLHYQVSLNTADAPPELSPSNRKYALAGKVWRRMPLWLTRPMGGTITKWVP